METEECIVLTDEYVKEQGKEMSCMFPDQQINPRKFLEVARDRVVVGLNPLPDDASVTKTRAWINNVRFLIELDIEHFPEDLLSLYNIDYKKFSEQSISYDQHAHSLIQEEKFNKFNMSDVVEINDIDRPNPNGMTPMCDIIMMSDDVGEVRNLIEVFGACPLACSGKTSPLEMANQLGRAEIAEYLEEVITELSASTT